MRSDRPHNALAPLAGKIPAGAALTGATGGVRSGSPHKALALLAGKIPGGAALTGATGGVRSGSPHKALVPRPGKIPRWRCDPGRCSGSKVHGSVRHQSAKQVCGTSTETGGVLFTIPACAQRNRPPGAQPAVGINSMLLVPSLASNPCFPTSVSPISADTRASRKSCCCRMTTAAVSAFPWPQTAGNR